MSDKRALVIGAGVAGLTAATWLRRYRAPFDWVSADGELGGMLRTVYNPIIDYPGLRADSGHDAVDALREWGAALPAPMPTFIERVRADDGGFVVTGSSGEKRYQLVLVATGTRRKLLGVPGEQQGLEKYVLTSTVKAPERFTGRTVMLIGGGDAAVEGALNAADAGAANVIVVSRSDIRAQRQFMDRFAAHPNIRRWPNFATPVSFSPHGDGCRVTLDSDESIDVGLAVVRIGVEPVRPRIEPRPKLDERGFLVVDGRGETDVPGLFAAGDVTSTPLRSIATSAGDGTRAARTMAELLDVWTNDV